MLVWGVQVELGKFGGVFLPENFEGFEVDGMRGIELVLPTSSAIACHKRLCCVDKKGNAPFLLL